MTTELNKTPVARSPLHDVLAAAGARFEDRHGWQIAASLPGEVAALARADVVLCDRSHRGKVRIEGETAAQLLQAESLPIGAGRRGENGRLYRLRHDLFFLSTAAGKGTETAVALARQAAAAADLITVTDVTHGNAEFWLIGPDSAELLSRLCGLDFHDSQFPDAAARQSSVAKTTQLIIRHDLAPDLPAYTLIGPRSLAAYLWQTILQAGHDLNIQSVAEETLSQF